MFADLFFIRAYGKRKPTVDLKDQRDNSILSLIIPPVFILRSFDLVEGGENAFKIDQLYYGINSN